MPKRHTFEVAAVTCLLIFMAVALVVIGIRLGKWLNVRIVASRYWFAGALQGRG